MLNKEDALWWNEVEHDLYEENGHIFGVEFDLFNNCKNYYYKTIEDSRELYHFLSPDIYTAIEKFNAML